MVGRSYKFVLGFNCSLLALVPLIFLLRLLFVLEAFCLSEVSSQLNHQQIIELSSAQQVEVVLVALHSSCLSLFAHVNQAKAIQ